MPVRKNKVYCYITHGDWLPLSLERMALDE